MPRGNILPIAVLILAHGLTGFLQAQQTRMRVPVPSRPITQQLSDLLEPVNITVSAAAATPVQAAGTREVRVRWTTGSAASTPSTPAARPVSSGGSFSVSEQRNYPEPARQDSSLNLGPGRLFVATIDRNRGLKSWSLTLDPRIVRSEGPGADGTLTGETLYFEHTEFLVTIPDDPDIVELRLFEVQSEGQSHRLVSAGSVPIER